MTRRKRRPREPSIGLKYSTPRYPPELEDALRFLGLGWGQSQVTSWLRERYALPQLAAQGWVKKAAAARRRAAKLTPVRPARPTTPPTGR